MMLEYYDRELKKFIAEKECGRGFVGKMQNVAIGRFILKVFCVKVWFGKLVNCYHKSKLSYRDIAPFVDYYRIKLRKRTIQSFETFYDFFTRPFESDPTEAEDNVLVSPADSKLLYYVIDDDVRIKINQLFYSLNKITNDNSIIKKYKGGTCLVFRISQSDIHRYRFIDDGKIILNKKIPNKLLVRNVSSINNIYNECVREMTIMDTKQLGRVIQIEIGAPIIGEIKNHQKNEFVRNEEKGYFGFGESIIVILLNQAISIDETIVDVNSIGIETKVHAGEKIGVIC